MIDREHVDKRRAQHHVNIQKIRDERVYLKCVKIEMGLWWL